MKRITLLLWLFATLFSTLPLSSQNSNGKIDASSIVPNRLDNDSIPLLAGDHIPPDWRHPPSVQRDPGGTWVLTTDMTKGGKVYYVVVNDGAPAPNRIQISGGVVGATSTSLVTNGFKSSSISTLIKQNINNLIENTAYDLYVLAANYDGVRQSQATKVSFTTHAAVDDTAPSFETSTPSYSSVTQTAFILTTDIDEAGDIFYVVLADGAAAPTSSDVVNGTGNGGAAAVTSDNASVTSGGFTNAFSVTGLTAGTDYDLYVVARDDEGSPNLQGSPTKLDVTTAGLISLTITGLSGSDKIYDDTTVASASGIATLVGVEAEDLVIFGGSPVFTFASANVGTGITITTTGYTINGADAGKYTLTQPTLSGDITGKELSITGITGGDKVYDGTTAATASGTATLSGIIGADDVMLKGSPVFTFAAANVGTGITITTTGYTLGDIDAGNYTLTQPTLSGDITGKELSITGITGGDKVYDGTTAATASGTATLSGIIGADDVMLKGSPVFTFAAANVGTGITITTTGYTLGDIDAGNYTLTQPTLSGDITAKELTITGITGVDKVYDGTTASSASGIATLVGVEAEDLVILGGLPVFTFASANVGTGITITTSGYTISGDDSGNYTLTQPTLSGDITAKELTITGIRGVDKVYDDTTAASASGTATLVRVEAGDDVFLGGSPVFTFASANVGIRITITTSGYTISGDDSGNYTLTQPTLSGDITAKELTITGLTGEDKVYDRTTVATASGTATLAGIVGEDNVSLEGQGVHTFASANVGDEITITTTGYTLGGSDEGNYTLSQPTLSAAITAKELTIIRLKGEDKVYDTTTAATASGNAILSGVVIGDVVDLGGTPVYTFTSANVGVDLGIGVSGYSISGVASGNYTLLQPSDLTAAITPAELTITGLQGDDKLYDTTAAASASGNPILLGALGSDEVILGGTLLFGFGVDYQYRIEMQDDYGDGWLGDGIQITFKDVDGNESNVYANMLSSYSGGPFCCTWKEDTEIVVVPPFTSTVTFEYTGDVYPGEVSFQIYAPDDTLLYQSEDGPAPGELFTKEFESPVNVGVDKMIAIKSYTIGGAHSGNYALTQPLLSADITPAPLTIAAGTGQNKVYGSDDPTNLIYTFEGLVNNETEAVLDTAVAIARAQGEDAGLYRITVSEATAMNYDITFDNSIDFEITKALVTVIANDQSKIVGDALPNFTISYDGFVNGETAAVLDEAPVTSTMATKDSSVGDYVIALTPGADGNYNIEIIEGILTISADADGNLLSIQKSYGISPNGDGTNDTWSIKDVEKYPNNMARIYNRSGKLLYQMKGYNNTFEGYANKTNSSKKLPVGVYYYVLDLNVPGAPPIKGWIYINY